MGKPYCEDHEEFKDTCNQICEFNQPSAVSETKEYQIRALKAEWEVIQTQGNRNGWTEELLLGSLALAQQIIALYESGAKDEHIPPVDGDQAVEAVEISGGVSELPQGANVCCTPRNYMFERDGFKIRTTYCKVCRRILEKKDMSVFPALELPFPIGDLYDDEVLSC
jgi:hypothetical protein